MEQLSQTKQLTPLEAWKYIKAYFYFDFHKKDVDESKLTQIIETALEEHQNDKQIWENYLKEIKNLPPIEVQMRLKALEIIKEKRVEIRVIFHTDNAMEYNEKTRQYYDCLPLTQEEFYLLKGVLL